MATSKTLAQMRTSVRQKANMESTQFVTDAEVNGYLNESLGELHDLLTDTYEDWFTTTTTVTVAPGSNTIVLPEDFLKLRRLQWLVGGDYLNVRRAQLAEIEQWSATYALLTVQRKRARAYVLMQNALFLLPEQSADGTYRLWYAQAFLPLATDQDQFIDLQGWSEYAVVDAAIKCLCKEESDPSALMQRKAELKARIEAAASNRDAGAPARIIRVAKDWTITRYDHRTDHSEDGE